MAKKMYKSSLNLKELPTLAFKPETLSRFRIKRQPEPHCLSSIEAIYEILTLLEVGGTEAIGIQKNILLETLEDLVSFQETQKALHLKKKGEMNTPV